MDIIDSVIGLTAEWAGLWETCVFLIGRGLPLSTSLTPAGMEEAYKQAKYLLCVLTVWDMMLGPTPESKRQRTADMEAIKKSVSDTCASIFPASLMSLLGEWGDGKDIALALP